MSKAELQTPSLQVPSNHQFDEISPTQPLNFTQRHQQHLHQSKLLSEHSLHSILTQQTMNSYETAREFEESEGNEALEGGTTSGLGIADLSLMDPSNVTSNSIVKNTASSKSTISVYDDDPTPRIHQGPNSGSEQNFEEPLNPYLDEPTPIVPSSGAFEHSHSPIQTPLLSTSPHTSVLSSSEIMETPKPVKVNHIHESPRNLLISSSPTTSAPFTTKGSLTSPKTTEHDFSFVSDADDTIYSHETTFLEKVQNSGQRGTSTPTKTDLVRPSSAIFSPNKRISKFVPCVEDYALTALFVVGLHSFDSSTLELNSDSAICLSFEKDDVVFVHSVDATGWAEVTLIKNLKRGWVPINFFTELIKDEPGLPLSKSKLPLRNLLISSAIFLNNPIDNPQNGDAGFALAHINNIRDGVRDLLEQSDCLSRSTAIVKKRPVIRRMRKSLLADWYSLMIKADSYKHSKSLVHLETLQLMVLQVIKKSITFFEIWGLESESLKREEQAGRTLLAQPIKHTKPTEVIYLKNSPHAKERLNEIHNLLFNYIGLLLGRLDMVEHNPTGCQVLETITHQMILLLREILFISKSCVLILNERNTKSETRFDDNLDTLLSLVSELVSSVKNFVTKTINDDFRDNSVKVNDALYYYTPEGDDLIGIVSRMTRSISSSVDNCHKNLSLIGDFRLSNDKRYPDFVAIQISPEQFIKTCSVGMIKTLPKDGGLKKLNTRENIKRQSRFSMVRSGTGNDNSLTTSGSNLLQEFLPDSKSFIRSSVFEPFITDSQEELKISHDIRGEIIRDQEGRLLGASFRALVMMLTDEMARADPFFVSTFFLTFKLFSSGVELIEELILRFNLTNKGSEFEDPEETGEYSSYESRMKNRRKLICKMFQIWLQSYWDYVNDYNLLPTLINFFNEGVSLFLPIEAKRLIELCSKLTVLTPSKIKDNRTLSRFAATSGSGSLEPTPTTFTALPNNSSVQLVKRAYINAKHTSMVSHSSSVSSISSLNHELDDDDYIFEEYGLAKLNTSHRSSMLLPLPGLSFKNNSLLSKNQISEIENLVLIYRRTLSSGSWVHNDYARYSPADLKKMLPKWFEISRIPSSKVANVDYNLADLNSFELAKQLTIIESRIFLAIKPEELLNNNYTEKKSKMNMSPNISQSLLFTNALSEYLLDSILDTKLSLRDRVHRIRNWLNVALSCYYLKNFNSLAAIIITLQNHILSRLTELWLNLPDKYQGLFEDLKKIIHPSNNYKGYRYKISKILEEADTKTIPVVPYINLFLQDLTFIHEGNKDFRNSNSFLRARMINFDKFLRISKVVSNLENLQVGYDNHTINSQSSKKSKRSSIFSLTSSISGLNDELSPLLPLQEFILLEFWKVHQLNLKDTDRNWSLSKQLKD